MVGGDPISEDLHAGARQQGRFASLSTVVFVHGGFCSVEDATYVWNTMLCDAAKANQFDCVDIYHAFNGPMGPNHQTICLPLTTRTLGKGNALIAKSLVANGFAPLGCS
jgi:hypothetical protein